MNSEQQTMFYQEQEAVYQERLSELVLDPIRNNEFGSEAFNAYLIQDLHYLEAFSPLLTQLSMSGLLRNESRDILAEDAQTTNGVRDAYAALVFRCGKDWQTSAVEDWTSDYISHERDAVEKSTLEGLASILPCYVLCPGFVREVRLAMEARVQAGSKDSEYFRELLTDHLSVMAAMDWKHRIMSVWKDACRVFGPEAHCPEVQTIFKTSADHEWKLLEGSTRTFRRKKSTNLASPDPLRRAG